jgi:hypothetical protein
MNRQRENSNGQHGFNDNTQSNQNNPTNIQCGNFNWNKIHNLDMGDFCKKSRNRSIFVFLAHILA